MTPHYMLRRWLYPTAAAMLAAALLGWGCGKQTVLPLAPEPAAQAQVGPLILANETDPLTQAIKIQNQYSPLLMSIPGVLGTGASLDELGRGEVVVLLEHDGVPGIPALLSGLKVEQIVTGIIQPWALTASYRPVPIGVSAGNADPSACALGTIGCVVDKSGVKYFLSCNHVFALQNQAAIGSAVTQPSQPDLPSPCAAYPADAVIGTLADFEPVVYDNKTANIMDAAIVRVADGITPTCSTPAGYYGFPGDAGELRYGPNGRDPRAPIMKVGRTTGQTTGSTKAVDVKVRVNYASGTAYFTDQILTTPGFGDVGDSGALVVLNAGLKLSIGMIIGGSNNGTAIVSPILPVLKRFGATLCNS